MSTKEFVNCFDCKYFKCYDDGDNRWDNFCEKYNQWTDSDGVTFYVDGVKLTVDRANTCESFIERD